MANIVNAVALFFGHVKLDDDLSNSHQRDVYDIYIPVKPQTPTFLGKVERTCGPIPFTSQQRAD